MMSNRRTSDSHPYHFSRADLQEMSIARERWLDYCHPLDFISIDLIRRAQNDALRGAYAQLQWIWEQMEPADPVLATCVERRLGALVRIPWNIVKKDGLNDAEDAIAEAQVRTLTDFAHALENLDEVIPALAQASFRHFRRVQLLETEYGDLRLNVTDNWNWCRDGYCGGWQWNPAATFGLCRGERLPVPPESIITRLCPRPIDQPAMMLCLDRKNAKAQWLVFNGRYGTPPLFAILPEGIDEQTRADYIAFANQCVSNAAGVLPAGSDVKAVAPGSTGPDTFRGILDLSTQELVLRATGGLMTMLTAPGAGTNTDTGSAHQDAFNDLAEREAEEIAAVLNAGLFAPILDQWHPGQPHLAGFVMRRPDSDNASGAVANITALAAAGYRPQAGQVSELTGLEVTDAGLPAVLQAPGGMAAMLNSARRRWLPLMRYKPAREVFERALNAKIAGCGRGLNSCNRFAHDADCPHGAQGKDARTPGAARGRARREAELREAAQEARMDAASMESAGWGKRGQKKVRDTQRQLQLHRPPQDKRLANSGAATAAGQEDLPALDVNAGGGVPLTPGELAALQAMLGGGLDTARIVQDTKAAQTALEGAVREGMGKYPQEAPPPIADPLQGVARGQNETESPAGGEGGEDTVATNREYARHADGRFAPTGAGVHSHKGARGSSGNPKGSPTKSNTPLKATRAAKVQAQVDATEHSLKAREGGGGVVRGAAWVNGKRLDVQGGNPGGGAAHMKKHYKPGDTSRREAAKDTHLGRRKQDRSEIASIGKSNKVILGDKGDHFNIVTTRKKTDHD